MKNNVENIFRQSNLYLVEENLILIVMFSLNDSYISTEHMYIVQLYSRVGHFLGVQFFFTIRQLSNGFLQLKSFFG